MAKKGADKQEYVRSGKGYSRNQDSGTGVPSCYPSDPAAIRRLNSEINNRHARIPNGWKSSGK